MQQRLLVPFDIWERQPLAGARGKQQNNSDPKAYEKEETGS